MKDGTVVYERVYQILRNKIESGLLPYGSKLPSRAELCLEFKTSEKTVRRAVELLAQAGYIETMKRRRPVIVYRQGDGCGKGLLPLQKADATVAGDILKTGIFLCYPVISHGISLCTREDWRIPETIFEKMDPGEPKDFWKLSSRFWRFFILRNENEIILQAVDSLGLNELQPRPGTLDLRTDYHNRLQNFIRAVKNGGCTRSVQFPDLSALYGYLPEQRLCVLPHKVAPDSPLCIGSKVLERKVSREEERYSRVYLDILGLIAVGRSRPGQRLPSHAQLCQTYGVSVDTTINAVRLLQEWGAVKAVRGRGIFVLKDLEELKQIQIPLELIACHVRRFLDGLELLSLTVEGTAAHAASCITCDEAAMLAGRLEKLWNEKYLYQLSPIVLLEYITDHIQLQSLRVIYQMILTHYHIGRGIPKLVELNKTEENCRIHRECLDAVRCLTEREPEEFAKKAGQMFRYTHRLVIERCRQLGYWEAAENAYDGSLLWK